MALCYRAKQFSTMTTTRREARSGLGTKGAGMASTYFSADLGAIAAAGSGLQSISSTVRSGAQFGPAAGAEDYPEVTGAVEDFRGQWDNAVSHLTNSIGALGTTTNTIGALMRQHDEALAAAWDGKSQG